MQARSKGEITNFYNNIFKFAIKLKKAHNFMMKVAAAEKSLAAAT